MLLPTFDQVFRSVDVCQTMLLAYLKLLTRKPRLKVVTFDGGTDTSIGMPLVAAVVA